MAVEWCGMGLVQDKSLIIWENSVGLRLGFQDVTQCSFNFEAKTVRPCSGRASAKELYELISNCGYSNSV